MSGKDKEFTVDVADDSPTMLSKERDFNAAAADGSGSLEYDEIDVDDPLRWSKYRKHVVLAVVSLLAFLSDFSSAIGIPDIEQQVKEWHSSPNTVQHNLSGNLISLGIGSWFVIIFASYAGRLPTTIFFLLIALASAIWCAEAQSLNSYIAARCVNGFFSTVAQAGGLMWIQDLFFVHEHPRKINYVAAAIILSPYVGPMVSSFVDWHHSWRWGFWIVAIFTGVCILISLVCLDETYFPREAIRKGYSLNGPPRSRLLRILGVEQRRRGLMNISFAQAALRPFRSGLKVPVLCLVVYYFMNFGWVVGVNATVGLWLANFYNFGPKATGFFYFAGIVGIVVGWVIGHWLYDFIGRVYVRKYGVQPKPELRLLPCYIGAVMMLIALVLLGQGLAHIWHYMAIAVFYALQVTGMLIVSVSVNAYLLQLYPEMPGEVGAWINVGRSASGCMVVYVQLDWVAMSGPAATLGAQGGIVMASLVFVVFLQLFGQKFR